MKTIIHEGEEYIYETLQTSHAECMSNIAHKCNWEQMPRTSVLIEYENIVCAKCRKEINIRKSR